MEGLSNEANGLLERLRKALDPDKISPTLIKPR